MPEVVLPPEEQQPQPPVLTNNPQNTEMEFFEGIGWINNFVEPHVCDAIINSFDYWYERKYMVNDAKIEHCVAMDEHGKEMMQTLDTGMDGTTQFGQKGQLGRKDTQLFLETHDKSMALALTKMVGDGFQLYTKEYAGMVDSADPLSSWTYKVQKTPPGGGYHVWHCENASFLYRDRVCTWMIYLNDIPIENGGATDFLHQNRSFQPTKGTIIFWPAAYTHMHRGAFLTGDIDKYIATGWFCREPRPGM
tara:strand:- start:2430 stop:3176 length:747 start_codon:yes stop_codon:yes gene_type:complete